MGKATILLVLSLGLNVGLLSYSLLDRSGDAVKNYADYYETTVARNIANTAVELTLQQLRDNSSWREGFEGVPFNDGKLYATLKDTFIDGDNYINIAATGEYPEYNGHSMTIIVLVKSAPGKVPDVESAVALNVNRLRFLMPGTADIDGRDHNLFGNVIGPGLPGMTVPSAAESTTVVNGTSGSASIVGTPSVKSSTNLPDPYEFVDAYIANADYTYGSGNITSETWGSPSDPKIVFCDGSGGGWVSITGNVTGWGILIIKGKAKISGNFLFHGLVVVYQDPAIESSLVTGRGTVDILGAVVFAGAPNSFFELKGTPKIAYSSEAIKIADLAAASLSGFEVLSYWE
ncbi:MAG: hypothetical protein ACE5H0_04775 [Bacteroidota bacterium]